jgi:ABC-type multidrug transport system permease subunit
MVAMSLGFEVDYYWVLGFAVVFGFLLGYFTKPPPQDKK